MVTRIVKLHFQETRVLEFLTFFETIKNKVNSFPGCNGMQLLQDAKDPQTIITYSHWDSEKNLNEYRDSETFGAVWPTIKPWFDKRPEAWTTQTIFDGFQEK